MVDTVCKDRQYCQLNLLNREKLYAKAMSGYRGQAAVSMAVSEMMG